jgi:hypothetical protein
MSSPKGTAAIKSFNTKSVAMQANLREFVRVYGQISNLEKFTVVRVSTSLNGNVSTSNVRGLSKFKYISQTRTINAFNYLLGSGGFITAIKTSTDVGAVSARASNDISTVLPENITATADIVLIDIVAEGSITTRGVSDVAAITL